MEKEVKQEQPAQELDDEQIETVSGGVVKSTPNDKPKPSIIYF